VREGTTMLESCMRPDLVVEITLQPVRRYGVDAAIFYSDIVLPLKSVGFDIEIKPGVGPVSPTRSGTAGPRGGRPVTPRDVPYTRSRSSSWSSELGGTR
jgi:uroporphyrinogen decarboxylase